MSQVIELKSSGNTHGNTIGNSPDASLILFSHFVFVFDNFIVITSGRHHVSFHYNSPHFARETPSFSECGSCLIWGLILFAVALAPVSCFCGSCLLWVMHLHFVVVAHACC